MQNFAIKNIRTRTRGPRLFLSAMLRAPREVGSIAPASRFLGRKIAQQVDVHRAGWVIELGAGTGTVTKALLAAGVKPERLMAIERDRRMHTHLQRHFPEVRALMADAVTLTDLLVQEGSTKVNCVVSCLPLLTIPKDVAEAVLKQVFAVLPDDGIMVQYTYGPRSPVTKRQQKRLGIKGRRAGRVLLNVPPATVWCYKKQ